MSDIFITHVEEDADLALEIALALERACYGTWCYEVDSLPGPTYLNQTRVAIDRATAVVVVISPRALGSQQVTRELVRAFEKAKRFIPVLRQMSHIELQERQPEWADMLGAAASIRVPSGGAANVLPRILEGLRALGIAPTPPAKSARIQMIEMMMSDEPGPSLPVPPPPVPGESEGDVDPAGRAGLLRRVLAFVNSWSGILLAAAALLVFLGVQLLESDYWNPAPPTPAVQRNGRTTTTATSDGPLIVGVMDIRALGAVPEWMLDFTRDGINTVLSKAPAKVRVYSTQKIDLVRRKRRLSEIEAAERLGIEKMISGTISINDTSKLTLEVQVVDIGTGWLDDTERVEGYEGELVQMQNRAVEKMVRALKVALDSEDVTRMFSRSDDAIDSYKLLTETMGGVAPEEPKPAEPSHPQKRGSLFPLFPEWPARAWAGDGDEAAVREVLERYRAALEAKDLKQLTAVQDVNDTQLQALARYFENANGLKVKFTDVDILLEGDEAVATFTRDDVFEDKPSGHDRHLEVRVSSVLAKDQRGWKIRGFRKPS